MKELFFVASSYYSTEDLTPEIAFALLIELDQYRFNTHNIRGTFDFYQDACKQAKHLSEKQGKKCPVIRIQINPKTTELQEEANWAGLNFDGKKYSVLMKESKSLAECPSEVRVVDATFDLADAYHYKPTISFQYESLDMDKVSAQLKNISATRSTAEDKLIGNKTKEKPVANPEPIVPASTPVSATQSSATDLVPEQEIQSPLDFLASIKQQYKKELDILKEKEKKLKEENTKLKENLTRKRRLAFIMIHKRTKEFFFFIRKLFIATCVAAVSLAILGGMTLTMAAGYTLTFLVTLGASLKLFDLTLNAYHQLFRKKELERAKLIDQKNDFSDFTFALGFDAENSSMGKNIKSLLPENQSAEEELKTLLWLNPLLSETVLKGSYDILESSVKARLGK